MDDRFNLISMAVLGSAVVALGATVVSGEIFRAHKPEKPGYVVEGVEEEGAGGAAAEAPIEARLQTADVAKGEAVFKKCAACHTINQGGANGVGPNLWAAMGKPHGHVPGFAYSDALKSVPGTWDWKGMDSWLKSPKAYAPGTKMTFAGLSKGEDRANLIAYLNAQGSNLPMPAAPAADAAPAAAEGGATTADTAVKGDPAAKPAAPADPAKGDVPATGGVKEGAAAPAPGAKPAAAK